MDRWTTDGPNRSEWRHCEGGRASARHTPTPSEARDRPGLAWHGRQATMCTVHLVGKDRDGDRRPLLAQPATTGFIGVGSGKDGAREVSRHRSAGPAQPAGTEGKAGRYRDGRGRRGRDKRERAKRAAAARRTPVDCRKNRTRQLGRGRVWPGRLAVSGLPQLVGWKEPSSSSMRGARLPPPAPGDFFS